MKTYLSNLRPFERRVVVGVAAMLFVVLNAWFIIPRFSDWTTTKARLAKAREDLAKFEREIGQMPSLERKVKELEGEGYAVPPEDQALHFANAIQNQAILSKVSIVQQSASPDRTNQFFVEKSRTYTLQSGEAELVDFLYNLGAGASLIRVRDLTLRPDPPRYQLQANVKLVASYQKKITKPAASATTGKAGTPPAKATAKAPGKAPAASPPTASKSNPTAKRP